MYIFENEFSARARALMLSAALLHGVYHQPESHMLHVIQIERRPDRSKHALLAYPLCVHRAYDAHDAHTDPCTYAYTW